MIVLMLMTITPNEFPLKIACPVTAENKSRIIIPGIKYFAFMGTGKKISINLFSGKNKP